MAADAGHTISMSRLAFMLEKGEGIPVDKKEAAKYYEKSADAGDKCSICRYALMLQNGDGIPIDKKKSIGIFQKRY